MALSLTFRKFEQFCEQSEPTMSVDGYTYGIGECVQDGFDRHIFDRGVEERPHTFSILFLLEHIVQ
jgi:hypothetical protein